MPVRISGVNLNGDKRVAAALTEIYGIGRRLSNKILRAVEIDGGTRTKDLTTAEERSLRQYIEENVRVEGDLKREMMQNIRHHKDVGTYRGVRHLRNLPVRGQRTRTNSRTVRGNVRKTAGSGRRPAAEKT